jgi:hypothetical protein
MGGGGVSTSGLVRAGICMRELHGRGVAGPARFWSGVGVD